MSTGMLAELVEVVVVPSALVLSAVAGLWLSPVLSDAIASAHYWIRERLRRR